jgi:hypothetical protein
MGLGPSDWIAIAAIGAGALMGIMGKRIVAVLGIALLLLGLGGLGFSVYRGDKTAEMENHAGQTESCVIDRSTNYGKIEQNCK